MPVLKLFQGFFPDDEKVLVLLCFPYDSVYFCKEFIDFSVDSMTRS